MLVFNSSQPATERMREKLERPEGMNVESREVGILKFSEILIRWELKWASCRCWDTSRTKFNPRTWAAGSSWLSDEVQTLQFVLLRCSAG